MVVVGPILFSFYQYCVDFYTRIDTRFPLTGNIGRTQFLQEIMHLASVSNSHAAGGRVGCIQRTSTSHSTSHTYMYLYHMSEDILCWCFTMTNQSKIYMQNNETNKKSQHNKIHLSFSFYFIHFLLFLMYFCAFLGFFIRLSSCSRRCRLLDVYCWRLSFMTTFCYFFFFVW